MTVITEIFAYIFGFLCIYIFLYILLGFFFQDSSHEEFQKTLSRSLDIFMAVVVLTIGLTLFFSLSTLGNDKEVITQTLQDEIVNFMENPWSIVIIGIVIVALYLFIFLFRIPMTPSNKPFTIILLENGAWILLAILIIENVVRVLFKIDLVNSFAEYLNEMFSINRNNPITYPENPIPNNQESETDKSSSSQTISNTQNSQTTQPPQTTPINDDKKEVFNIAGNHFTYGDAPAVCAAYGAELATYDQVEEAYTDDAEWCNYGWSADQMALFPTQKDTWKKLQSKPSTANQCGRPGVNGGYIPNPNITFGVNCYGIKPSISDKDKKAMQDAQAVITQPTPLTPEEIEFNKKLQFWKQNAAKVLTINGFNENKWSEF
jgi:hypothetical protein